MAVEASGQTSLPPLNKVKISKRKEDRKMAAPALQLRNQAPGWDAALPWEAVALRGPGEGVGRRGSETQRLPGNSGLLGQAGEGDLGKEMAKMGFPGSDSISPF